MKALSAACSLLALALVPILTSCTTSLPEQKYLRQGSLTNIRKVVVVTSSDDVKVNADQNLGNSLLGVLFGPAGLALDWAIGSAVDAHRSAGVQADNRKETVAERLSAHFTKAVTAGGAFESIHEASADERALHSTKALSNYHALLRLKVTELSLRPANRNEWSLLLELSANMVSLREGREDALLWSRRERLAGGEPHELDFYKAGLVPTLDVTLARLAKRLADDLVYSK